MPHAPADLSAVRWRAARMLYNAALVILFIIIAFYIGPNYHLFGRLRGLTPADFVTDAETHAVPVVRALKQYQRDHDGALPNQVDDLVPTYIPAAPKRFFNITEGAVALYGQFNHRIIYEFTPEREGWRVDGVFTQGPISLPLVMIAPSTRPAK